MNEKNEETQGAPKDDDREDPGADLTSEEHAALAELAGSIEREGFKLSEVSPRFATAVTSAGRTPFWDAVLRHSQSTKAPAGETPNTNLDPSELAKIRSALPPVTCRCAPGGANPCCVAHTPPAAISVLRQSLVRIIEDRNIEACLAISAIELDNCLDETVNYPTGGFAEVRNQVLALVTKYEERASIHGSPTHQ